MIPATPYKGQKVGVFGLGKAGEASVAALTAGGAEVFAWDDKHQAQGVRNKATEKDDLSPVTCHLSPYADWPWQELKALVLAPGVAKTHVCAQLAQRHNVPIIGDIEILFQSQPEARYIGITGTNGKSTTTTLIGHILQEAGVRCEVGGNLGTAALSLAPLGADGIYVLELSSYQLDLIHTTRFNVAVLLNITPDHLDRHGDMAGYIAAKKHIFERQTADDVAIIAVDDEYTRQVAEDRCQASDAAVIKVSAGQKADGGVYVLDGLLSDTCHLPPATYDISQISSLTGQHNWQNAAVAYAAARACGVSPEKIIAAMRSFPGLRHRLQLVKTIDGVRFINDSKATNADAVQHALKPYKNIYWIAGGKAKSGGIESLAPLFGHIARAYLIGEAEDMFAGTLEGKVNYVCCGTLENAVKHAAEDAFREKKQDAVVLLSPACASFDQFTSFEHRGDVFCELVEGLG
ncbi:MAG: UDP-N-acetylmuramoyl-L-alanine--D-glutamate ligase [Alphaproteobacteria bacterium]|nr:UDP-N-acetylmuramoyl-L-alanine--D-glutamate ligase [Alphaproteobacteria bacterium]